MTLRQTLTLTALALGLAAPALAEDLTIGLATAQTGGLAPYDQPTLAGFQMRVDEINAAGGIAGKYPIKLIAKDTRSDSAQTALVAQELVAEDGRPVVPALAQHGQGALAEQAVVETGEELAGVHGRAEQVLDRPGQVGGEIARTLEREPGLESECRLALLALSGETAEDSGHELREGRIALGVAPEEVELLP